MLAEKIFDYLGPIVGKYLHMTGARLIFSAGVIIGGGTFILFGLLEWTDNVTIFLALSYILRFLEVIYYIR